MKNLNKSSVSNYVENTPNAAKLLSSLRRLDYSNLAAISSLVDNSIDAGADIIRIQLLGGGEKNLQRIEIWDNGCGMDRHSLHEALRLGSEIPKNILYDLGRNGVELLTASISLGDRLEVASLCDGKTNCAIHDLQEVSESNSFVIDIFELDAAASLAFKNSLRQFTIDNASSGTYVSIDKINGWQWTSLSASERYLVETLGQVFRKFIAAGKKIYVNSTEVHAKDPIYDYEHQLLAEEVIDVTGNKITLKLFELKDFGKTINEQKGFNIKNQGFYVLRNNREIASGQTFNLWNKHHDYNLLRAEFSYSGALDNYVNTVGIYKQKINPEKNQSLYDKLRNFVTPHLKQVRNRSRRRLDDRHDLKEGFTQVEKFITRKAQLLKIPKSSEKLTLHNVSFRIESMGRLGSLYNAKIEDNIIVIFLNGDHPFFSNCITAYEDDSNVLNSMCYLIFSMAASELRYKSTITNEFCEDLSLNLRVLMNP
jgi:hypothetical protein